MQFLSYIFGSIFIYAISFLPFHFLYLFSDFVFTVIFKWLGYRKKVVYDNLRKSFPEMKEEEIDHLARRFYRHFCDIIVETLKTFTMTEKQLHKRVKLINPEFLDEYEKKKTSIITVSGHFNNWEWGALSFGFHSEHQGVGIYKPLSNKYFDKSIRRSRMRFGLNMIPMKTVKDFFTDTKEMFNIGFIGDQWPSNPQKAYWTNFLNRETPVFTGAERYAKKYDIPVIYGKVTKPERGYYNIEYLKISDDPSKEEEGSITEKHTRILEQCIKENPEFWLWTHRRWKKSKEEVFKNKEEE